MSEEKYGAEQMKTPSWTNIRTAAGTSKGLDYTLQSLLNILLTILGKEQVHKMLPVIRGR